VGRWAGGQVGRPDDARVTPARIIAAMQDFKRLRVAHHSRSAIRATYAFTKALPKDELFGLSSQLRRASVSIGLNIAEGCSRETTKEFIRYLEIARGSAMEVEFGLIVTEDLSLGRDELRQAALAEAISSQRQISTLIKTLRQRLAAGTRK
jgi:four helix bundle protein